MTEQQSSTIPAVPTDLQSFGSTLATSASQLSTAGAAMTAQVQTARVAALKRAATAAVATYGADSTQATAANQAVTTAQAKTGQLQIVSQKAATTPPTVAADGWALHGRVYDASLNPQERYTVFMVDAQNNYISDYGFSYTDSTGYFLLKYPGTSASGSSSGADQPGAAASGSSAAPAQDEGLIDLNLITEPADTSQSSAASGSSSAASAVPQGFVQVCDANANPVLSSSTAFTPVTGQATYQVLTLSASGQSLGDPPAEIRAVALPPQKKTKTKKTATESSDSSSS